jgi:NADH dehydrogenase
MLPSSQPLLLEIIRQIFDKKPEKPKVLVVGYGWGGSSFVEHVNANIYNIKVVSKTTSRLNQPYMISNLEPSFTDPPPKMDLIEDEALTIEKTELKCTKSSYDYDYLVIATGSEPNDFGIKGVKEHCLMFKTVDDLENLLLKLKDADSVTVIGAGPTGIELAFKLESMGKKVDIIEASANILPGFSETMRNEVSRQLERAEIKVSLNKKISKVERERFITSDGSLPNTSIKIWTCGVKPVSFVRNFMNPLTTDRQLMVKPQIYAIGDSVNGHGPPTAQNAKAQGLYLATIFNSKFQDKNPYTYTEKGRVIDTTNNLIIEIGDKVLTVSPIFRGLYHYLTK